MVGPRLTLFIPLKLGDEKKKVFVVRDQAPIFSEALGFSLLIAVRKCGPAICIPTIGLNIIDTVT